MKRILAAFLCACLLVLPAAAVTGAPETEAGSAVLMEKETGAVLFEQNAHDKLEPASVTKVMTLLLVLEAIDDGRLALDDMVTVSAHAASMGGSQVYLKEGEQMSVAEMIKCVTVVSGNDCAVALAEHLAGSETAFVAQMNQRAQDLGMTNTHFSDPNGLGDENHYASALDMAKLGVACLQNPTVAEILSTRTITLEGRQLTNHNKLLWQYEGCTGMKTGYTRQAGRTLVSSAERNGQTLVCVTLNDRDDWNDHKAMLDYGFSKVKQVSFDDTALGLQVPVVGGVRDSISVNGAFTAGASVLAEEESGIEKRIEVPAFLYAPVRKGQTVGKLTYEINGKVLASVDLLAGEDLPAQIKQKSLWERFLDWFR